MSDCTRSYSHQRVPEFLSHDDTGKHMHPEITQAALDINPKVLITMGAAAMYFQFETVEEADRFHLFVYEWLMNVLRRRAEADQL